MRQAREGTTVAARSPAGLSAGKRVDRYELCELIGHGGMGAVYRALDTKLGRTVALKTVPLSNHPTPPGLNVRERFLREALAISKVEHRNVVQILDFGLAPDGTPFLVMEHLRGRDLGSVLVESNTPLPVPYVADLMLGICAALRACHRVGIVHRDLKPGNIFLVETDTGTEVKVLDFGVSKVPNAEDLTRDGQILGTPQYLAPEQIAGQVGPESDQYALGVLLYACLTLRLPYESHRNADLFRAIARGEFQPPREIRSELPEAIDSIVRRTMRISPVDRFESVHALGQALWPLCNPRAQQEWKSYYFPTTLGAQSPQAASELHETQILERPSPSCVLGRAYPVDASTKLGALCPGLRDATPNPCGTPHSNLAGASLVARRGVSAAIAGAALLAVVVGGLARHQTRGRQARVLAPKVAATGDSKTLPPPVAETAPPIVVETPPPDPVWTAVLAPPDLERPAPAHPRRARTSIRARGRKAPFEGPMPNIDSSGIGIPAN